MAQTARLERQIPKQTAPRISSKIEAAIQSSRKMLEWADDWDEEGSQKFEAATWKRAVHWLRATARAFHRLQGVWIEPPRILPGPEGSIDIHWKNAGRELLVNFPENAAEPVEYYGSGGASDVIKGKLDGAQASAWVLVWLKK